MPLIGELQAKAITAMNRNKVDVFFIVSAPSSAKLKPEIVKELLRINT